MSEFPGWQKQFQAWYGDRYKGQSQTVFESDSGVSRATWSKYLKDSPVDIDKLARHVKQKLYGATKLECFKVDDVRYGRLPDGKKAPLNDWQVRLVEHIEKNYSDCVDFSRKTGLKNGAVRHLIERVRSFDSLTKRTRDLLYKATKIDVFKCEERYVGKTYNGKIAPLNAWQVELINYLDRHALMPRQVSKKVGLKENAMRNYLGNVMNLDRISAKNLEKLYQLTGLEIFRTNGAKPAGGEVRVLSKEPSDVLVVVGPCKVLPVPRSVSSGQDISDLVSRVAELQRLVAERVPMPSAGEGDLVKQTVGLFYSLAGKLEGFKSSAELRERLTKKLSKSDVGRMTALLHTIYKSKDDFDQWMMLSGYSYGGK